MSRTVLGRGIGALIPDGPPTEAQSANVAYTEIPIDRITPNPSQPRREIGEESIRELSDSIRREGILQPIIVQTRGDGFELIAGERRLRAAGLAGLTVIPARVLQSVDDQTRAVLALVENLQREDLDPLEEAMGLRELQTRYGMSQEQVAAAVGKDRSTVANSLRILQLPTGIRDLVASGKLTAGHGRALLSLSDAGEIEKFAARALKEGWSVRQLEHEVAGDRPRRGRPLKSGRVSRYRALEEALKRKFGTQVAITHRLGKGKIVIEYYSEDDLTRLMDLFEVRLD